MSLRARFPLDRTAVKAADAALHDKTRPPGRRLDPTAPEDAALRNAWMQAYAEAGGAVETLDTSVPVASPVIPCQRFIELRYLHCDGTPVKGAQFHIRAQGYAQDGVLDGNGFIHLGGVPELAGFTYWFDKDPQTYRPAGPKLPSNTGAAAAEHEVLDWVWGLVQGDFNPDPTLGQIAANTLLGLIPLVDQALDLRDLIAGLKNVVGFYMEDELTQEAHEDSLGLPYEAWLWLGLFLTALGCIPELGSAVKGVLKALIKALQDAAKAAGGLSPAQLTRVWGGLLKVLNQLGISPGNAHRWLRDLPGKLDSLMAQAAQKIRGAMDILDSLLDRAASWIRRFPGQRAERALQRIHAAKIALARAYQRLDAMKQRLNAWIKEQLNKVLSGKRPIENSGSINTPAKQEGANVHRQEKAPPPEPEIPPNVRPGHTIPTGTKGGKPTGRRTRIDPADKDPDNIRSLNGENRAADVLSDNGYHVEQNPSVPGNKNPDYLIEGKRFDCKTPVTGRARNVASEISDAVNEGQADRIVLNLEHNDSLTLDAMKKQLDDWPIDGLKEVIVIKNGEAIPFWP